MKNQNDLAIMSAGITGVVRNTVNLTYSYHVAMNAMMEDDTPRTSINVTTEWIYKEEVNDRQRNM